MVVYAKYKYLVLEEIILYIEVCWQIIYFVPSCYNGMMS